MKTAYKFKWESKDFETKETKRHTHIIYSENSVKASINFFEKFKVTDFDLERIVCEIPNINKPIKCN